MLNFTKFRLPLLLLALALFFFSGCMEDAPSSSADPFADCRYGAPKPIFGEDVNLVTRHGFRLEEGQAVEAISFDGGLQVSIIQSGCDYIHQEFHFNSADDYKGAPAAYWIQEAINKFYFLGQLGPAYVVYASVADALKERGGQLRLGQSVELQPGFFAKIDNEREHSGDALVVTLSERPVSSVASK